MTSPLLTPELIERAARAIFARVSSNDDPRKTWDGLAAMPQHNSLLTFYRENAKAAITAILPDIIEQVAKMADDVESPSAGLWGRGFYAAAREIASAQRDLAQVDSGAG